MAVVKQLFFYPIKSFRGFSVSDLQLSPRGVKWDRHWMLVDEKNQFLTQRQLPALARIGVAMDETEIELSLHEHGSIDFGLEETEGAPFPVKIWKREAEALEVSAEVSAWVSGILNRSVRLVKLAAGNERTFVDDAPSLVVSLASVKLLEATARKTFSLTRFRPNIVLDGTEAHAEDLWTGFQAGSVHFLPHKACTRCKITTVHPLTGEVGDEPLTTLGTYRRGEKGVMFGFYYRPENEGRIKVGDALKID